MEDMSIMGVLSALLQAVLVASIPIVAKFVVGLIRAKVNEILSRVENENISSIIERVGTLVSDVVSYVSQTYVDDLKKVDRFSAEEHLAALQLAYERIVAMIDDNAKNVLDDVFGDVNIYIYTLIEAAIKNRAGNSGEHGEDNKEPLPPETPEEG